MTNQTRIHTDEIKSVQFCCKQPKKVAKTSVIIYNRKTRKSAQNRIRATPRSEKELDRRSKDSFIQIFTNKHGITSQKSKKKNLQIFCIFEEKDNKRAQKALNRGSKMTGLLLQTLTVVLILASSTLALSDCGDDCLSCSNKINSQGGLMCKQCATTFRLYRGQCVKCQLEGCSQCGDNTAICRGCVSGYYNATVKGDASIREVKKCSRCIPGCLSCSDGLTCILCDTGLKYFEGKGGKPGQCIEGDNGVVVIFVFVGSFVLIGVSIYFVKKWGLFGGFENRKKARKKAMSAALAQSQAVGVELEAGMASTSRRLSALGRSRRTRGRTPRMSMAVPGRSRVYKGVVKGLRKTKTTTDVAEIEKSRVKGGSRGDGDQQGVSSTAKSQVVFKSFGKQGAKEEPASGGGGTRSRAHGDKNKKIKASNLIVNYEKQVKQTKGKAGKAIIGSRRRNYKGAVNKMSTTGTLQEVGVSSSQLPDNPRASAGSKKGSKQASSRISTEALTPSPGDNKAERPSEDIQNQRRKSTFSRKEKPGSQ